MLAIYIAALALLVGAVRATFAHAFVDAYTEPGEGFVYIVLGAWHEALRVGVFDAENHLAAVLTGKEVIIEGRAYTADVEGACGRGGEAYAHFTFCLRHCGYF